jgi:uncharacterized membrane-anchored protein YhcB (DUF1043 family)
LPENIFLNGSNFAILGFILFYFGKEIIAFFKKDKVDENKQMEMYINATTSQTDKLINKISDNNNTSFSALVDAMKEFTNKQNHLVEAIQELATATVQKNVNDEHLTKNIENIYNKLAQIEMKLIIVEERTKNCPKQIKIEGEK